MQRKRIANLADFADDNVEQARWKARLFIDARQQQPTRDWGVFGRLHHDAVAERERRGDGAVREMHRKVPRADHTHDSEGTAIDSALLAWNVDGQDAAGDPSRHARGGERPVAYGAPFRFGFQARAAGLRDQPIDDLRMPAVD